MHLAYSRHLELPLTRIFATCYGRKTASNLIGKECGGLNCICIRHAIGVRFQNHYLITVLSIKCDILLLLACTNGFAVGSVFFQRCAHRAPHPKWYIFLKWNFVAQGIDTIRLSNVIINASKSKCYWTMLITSIKWNSIWVHNACQHLTMCFDCIR